MAVMHYGAKNWTNKKGDNSPTPVRPHATGVVTDVNGKPLLQTEAAAALAAAAAAGGVTTESSSANAIALAGVQNVRKMVRW